MDKNGEDICINVDLFWLPPHNLDKKMYPPMIPFRIVAKFTSDFARSFEAVVKCAEADSNTGRNFQKAQIEFPFSQLQDIRRLGRKAEVLLMDGYKVIAVCRNIKLSNS